MNYTAIVNNYQTHGFRCLPLQVDGTKKPIGSWSHLRDRQLSEYEVSTYWDCDKPAGIGILPFPLIIVGESRPLGVLRRGRKLGMRQAAGPSPQAAGRRAGDRARTIASATGRITAQATTDTKKNSRRNSQAMPSRTPTATGHQG